MKKTEAFIEGRIKWRASQSKLPNRKVHFCDNLPHKFRIDYLSKVENYELGKPVLLFIGRKGVWTIVGTKMVVGFDGKRLNSVNFKGIQDIDSKKMLELPEEPTRRSQLPKKRNKNAVVVSDKAGNKITFFTRKGNDLFALWSILLMLSRLNLD